MLYKPAELAQRQRKHFIKVILVFFVGSLVGSTFAGPMAQIILLCSAVGMCAIFWLIHSRPNNKLAMACFL